MPTQTTDTSRMEKEKEYVCDMCVRVHGRNSNQKIQCPTCGKIVGCFWHDKNMKHIRDCRKK